MYVAKATVTSLCKNVSVTLQFLCDHEATWTPTETGGEVPNGIDTYSFAYNHVDNICKYSFEFNYKGACYTAPTIAPSACYIGRC